MSRAIRSELATSGDHVLTVISGNVETIRVA
jgi:hypothetical protein